MKLKIALGQLNPTVGDIKGNTEKAVEYINRCKVENIDVVVFPEMFITGYPAGDLLFYHSFTEEAEQSIIDNILPLTKGGICVLMGTPSVERLNPSLVLYNCVMVMQNDRILRRVRKTLLPNYDVFDEKRYFKSEEEKNITPVTVNIRGTKIRLGVQICEDLWDADYDIKVTELLVRRHADIIINSSASPFYVNKRKIRENLARNKSSFAQVWRNAKCGQDMIPFVYVNMVGGQDDLVFDGQSFAIDSTCEVVARCQPFFESMNPSYVEYDTDTWKATCTVEASDGTPNTDEYWCEDEQIIQALILNVRDCFNKQKIFKGIVIGLSGGVDSALTAVIASRAIGSENVMGIAMPSKFSSGHSWDDAAQLADNLGIKFKTVPIKEMYEAAVKAYEDSFGETPFGVAEENIQARCRMMILMNYSAKNGYMVCSTGNKSEISVGYFTLYGDSAGGKNVPGDLYKTEVYLAVEHINKNKEIIPQNTIIKPPSAELRSEQKDSDSLPPYETLDEILANIEDGHSRGELIDRLGESELIDKILKLYKNSEFKRDQLPRGIKVSPKAFGVGRRFPIVNQWTY